MSKFVLTAQLQLQGPTNVRQVVNQIQSQLGKGVNANINLQGGPQAQRQIQQITQQANKATTAASNMGKALGVSIRRFTGLAIATRAVSLFTNTLGAAVREGIAFERELIKISQVTGKTISQLKDLTNTITSLATGLGVSSTSLLQTSRILSQAGLSARETEVALKALAKTELAPTFDNISRTAEGAVAIFNQFGKGAAALEGQLGSLNAVAGKFAVESGDLIAAIRRTGGVFRAAGGDLNELIALFTSVRSTTRESAESIATGLRTILTRIQRPRTIEFLKQYGVELTNLEGKFVGPFEAVKRLSAATAGLEQGDLTFVKIAEEIAGFRQIGKVIPLLREFRVAQEALKVAQGGVNSLTDDAAKAQAALAVRINKVKEEFLALVRSITETTTFQVLAATVLTLAENLIRLGEAIKPILPLLSALVAVRAIRGVGNFVGGIGKGLQARGFASGGMVPGTGNRDTVPAMLTPGEFVIKKSSVAKLGAGNLAAMNNNRYATGGIVVDPKKVGGFFLAPKQGDPRNISVNGTGSITNVKALQRLGKDVIASKAPISPAGLFRGLYGKGGGTASNSFKKNYGGKTPSEAFKLAQQKSKSPQPSEAESAQRFVAAYKDPATRRRINKIQTKERNTTRGISVPISGKIKGFFPGGGDLEKNASVSNLVTKNTSEGLKTATQNAAIAVNQVLDTVRPEFDLNDKMLQDASTRISKDRNALATTSGFIFEGITNAITGAKIQGDTSRWDFAGDLQAKKDGLAKFFGTGASEFAGMIKADAKRTNSPSAIKSIIKKITNDVNANVTSGYSFKKFASGGAATGTDTVPAMLTPGEFVVNKQSAKSIGYSNLKRMNQVGKYAAGGVVTPNRHTYGNGVPGSLAAFQANPAGAAAPALQQVATAANSAAGATEKVSNTMDKIAIASFAVSSGLEMLKPTIDENSGAFDKSMNMLVTGTQYAINSFTGLAAAMALFNIQLDLATVKMAAQNAMEIGGDLLNLVGGGKGGLTASRISTGSKRLAKQGGRFLQGAGNRIGGKIGGRLGSAGTTLLSKSGGRAVSKLALSATKAATGIGLITLAAEAASAAILYFGDNTKAINEAIEKGDIEGAGKAARVQTTVTGGAGALKGAAAGATLGAAIGSALPVIGTFVGAIAGGAIGALNGFISSLDIAQMTTARTQAATVKLDKAIETAAKNSKTSLDKFNKGLIDSTALLNQFGAQEVQQLQQETVANIEQTGRERAGTLSSFGRGALRVGTLGIAGLMGVESGAQRNARLDKRQQEVTQKSLESQRKAFSAQAPARQAAFRRAAITGEAVPEAIQADKILEDADKIRIKAVKAENKGDTKTAEALRQQYSLMTDQAQAMRQEFENIKKAVEKAKAEFDALNLGLGGSAATIGAQKLAMDNLTASLDPSNVPLADSMRTLAASTTEAAQKISSADVGAALDEVGAQLIASGADPAAVDKMQKNMAAINKAQASIPQIFDSMKQSFEGAEFRTLDPEGQRKAFETALDQQLKSQGVDDATRGRIVSQAAGADLSDEEVDKLIAGEGIKVFEDRLKEIGENQLGQFEGQMQQVIEMQQKRLAAEKAVIDAQNNLVKAQQAAIDVFAEARSLEAGFGGAPVTIAERRATVAARANVSGRQAGLSDIDPNNPLASLRARRQGIATAFAGAQRGEGEQLTQEDQASQERLKAAQQEQLKTIRDLIKIQQDEIKQIQEKNRLEKESLDSLISGDINKFFEQQAAQGAIAAASTGNQQLMGAFGAQATGAAAQEIQRMQAAGVTDINGVALGGAGGLAERTQMAALQQRGLSGQAALRGAQIAAGTTPELEAANAQGRALAGELAATGQLGADMAEMELQSAQIVVKEANIVLQGAGADQGGNMQQRFEAAGGVGGVQDQLAQVASAGGLDPETVGNLTAALNDMGSKIKEQISSTEVALKVADVGVNLAGGNFLAGLTPVVKDLVIEGIQQEIGKYRQDQAGMKKNNNVLPK